MLYRCCIERGLIGAGSQRSPDILNAAYTATNGDGNKYLFRGPAHNIKHRGTIFKRSRDIEKNNLIRPFAIVNAASSTGSPASRRLTKLTPLTTRPAATSRQGMMRLASPIGKVGSETTFRQRMSRRLVT